MDASDAIALGSAAVALAALLVAWWYGRRQEDIAERSASAAEGALATSRTQAALAGHQTALADRQQYKADEPEFTLVLGQPARGYWPVVLRVKDVLVPVNDDVELISGTSIEVFDGDYDVDFQDITYRPYSVDRSRFAREGDEQTLRFSIYNDPSEIWCDLAISSVEVGPDFPRAWAWRTGRALRWTLRT